MVKPKFQHAKNRKFLSMNKKGDISIGIIITAVIALVVLVVIVAIFSGYFSGFQQDVQKPSTITACEDYRTTKRIDLNNNNEIEENEKAVVVHGNWQPRCDTSKKESRIFIVGNAEKHAGEVCCYIR